LNYIGKSINIKNRFRSHKRKYGKDIELLELDLCYNEEWKFWEKYYISLFKSWGFILTNQNNGGGGATKFTEETKQKISLAKKGKSNSNISRNKGRIITEEENKKRSLSLKGYKHSENRNNKISKTRKKLKLRYKSVIQLDKNKIIIKEFESITEATFKTGIKGIPNVLTGRAKTAGGFLWLYK
jgi:hypothetical protein